MRSSIAIVGLTGAAIASPIQISSVDKRGPDNASVSNGLGIINAARSLMIEALKKMSKRNNASAAPRAKSGKATRIVDEQDDSPVPTEADGEDKADSPQVTAYEVCKYKRANSNSMAAATAANSNKTGRPVKLLEPDARYIEEDGDDQSPLLI